MAATPTRPFTDQLTSALATPEPASPIGALIVAVTGWHPRFSQMARWSDEIAPMTGAWASGGEVLGVGPGVDGGPGLGVVVNVDGTVSDDPVVGTTVLSDGIEVSGGATVVVDPA